jgi:hypothetical protein
MQAFLNPHSPQMTRIWARLGRFDYNNRHIAFVTGFGVPEHRGDDSALSMLAHSGNFSPEIWSSGGCRLKSNSSSYGSRLRRRSGFDAIQKKEMQVISFNINELLTERRDDLAHHSA